METYIPLRIHSEFSVVHGLGSVEAILDQVAAHGFSAMALTDDMNFYGAIKFYKAARARGIKPIFGAELYIAAKGQPYHFTLFCQNETGYHNLTKLMSRAYLEGKRHQGIPWIIKSWLTPECVAGLIALSGGVVGELGRAILAEEGAETGVLQFWQGLFPDDRFYVELYRVGHPHEEVYLQKALVLAEKLNLPVVATHPSYFLKQEDFAAHEVRVAIHEGVTLEDPNRSRWFTDRQYLASAQDMEARFADCPVALQNSVELMKRCTVELSLGKAFLPQFPIPEGLTEADYFRKVAREGLALRGLSLERYTSRLEIELNVIIDMGFTGYFLIVADFIQWSKNNDIPVGPGRGSGAGSLVAYALKITDIDPLPYDLLFERFLNPERVSMPDFDIDFCMEGRDRVIDYVAQKYGRRSVSQIITFGTMAAKAVIRDVGRVQALSYGFVDSIAKLIPMDVGITLTQAMAQEPQLKKRYEDEEDVKALIDMGLKLEGTVRNVGKHAGGVVIAPSDLSDFAMIYCEEGSDQLVAGFDKDDVETAGLVKFDFLGLRNLTIIQMAVDIINEGKGLSRRPDIAAGDHQDPAQSKELDSEASLRKSQNDEVAFDINSIPLNDPKTFELLKKGETSAVFQLESRGMKELIKRLKPDSFEDIIALVALFRPGPLQSGMVDDFIARKHGHAKIEYPHADTAPILKSTYGVILYQEQVMLIPQILAGYTLGGADLLRRAMGKKKPEEMAKQRSVFVDGAKKNNISEQVSGHIFDLIEKFAGYGFNKSHSAAYALVAYQTAYLKAHYPAQFMAAVLSSDMDNTDKIVGFVDECKAMHLILLPPDILASGTAFTVVDSKTIRYGLAAIKGVGVAAIEAMQAERQQKPFADLFDFCKRMDLRKVNKRVIEALIYSGAMDKLGPNRATMLASIETAMQSAGQLGRAKDAGQHDLFALLPDEMGGDASETHWKHQEDWSVYDRVMHEKKVLGWCLSGHPLDQYRSLFKSLKVQPLSHIVPTARGEMVRLAGIITDLRRIKTKRGGFLTVIILEDFSHKIEVTCFSEVADTHHELLKLENKVVIDAEIQVDDFSGGFRGVAKKLHDLHEYKSSQAKKCIIRLTEVEASAGKLVVLKALFSRHKGPCPVTLHYEREDVVVACELDKVWSVSLSETFLDELNPFQFEVVF